MDNKQVNTPNSNRLFVRVLTAFALSLAVLISCDLVYRHYSTKLKLGLSTPVKLPVALSEFPMQIGDWAGQEVKISETVQEVAGNDDFVSRYYRNQIKGSGVSLYVAYSARPRYMRGHRPTVCYPSSGWNHDTTVNQDITTVQGKKIPCMIHRFSKLKPTEQAIVVLNFYLVNGQISLDEKSFDSLAFRRPNIEGDPAQYVAQIQISSASENAVLDAGRDFVDEIMRYFPDASGRVDISGTFIKPANGK